MVIDTSAVVAVLLEEEGFERFDAALDADPVRLMSAATLVECTLVLEGRLGEEGRAALDAFVGELGIEIVPFDAAQAEAARKVFRRFGKGRHKAGLNFGDCFSYALAKVAGEPLLFKGEDFGRTDVAAAV